MACAASQAEHSTTRLGPLSGLLRYLFDHDQSFDHQDRYRGMTSAYAGVCLQRSVAGQPLRVRQACKRIQTAQGAVENHTERTERVPLSAAAAAGWQRRRHYPDATLPQAVWQQRHRWARCAAPRALQVEAPSEGGVWPGHMRTPVLGCRSCARSAAAALVPEASDVTTVSPAMPALPCSAVSGGGVGAAGGVHAA